MSVTRKNHRSAHRSPALRNAVTGLSPLAPSIRRAVLSMAAATLSVGGAGVSQVALAESNQAEPARKSYAIPAGPLEGALTAFAKTSGILLVYPPAMVEGLRSPGLQGQYGFSDGVARLLAGTNLAIVDTGNGTLTLKRQTGGSSSAGNGILPAVIVGASNRQEDPLGPTSGYVARRSTSGSKTDTSLLENPQLVNVITRVQMDDQGARTVAEALRYTAGVLAEPNGFDVRYDWNYIRGYDTFGTQWVDGLALPGDPLNYAVPRINAYALERVEVIKGPASVLYGKAVPGGMLNQVTKRPLAEAQRAVEISTTNFGGAQIAADLTGPLDQDGQWLYRLVALERNAHTQVDMERDRQTMVAPSLTWRPSAATSLTLQAYYQKDDPLMSARFYPVVGTLQPNPAGQIPRNLYLGEPTTDTFHREYLSLGYAFEHRFDDTWSVRQNLRYGHAQQDMFLVRAHPFVALQANGRTLNRVSAISDDDVRSFSVDNQLEARVRTGPLSHTILAGLDYTRGKLSYNFANSAVGVPTLDIFNPVYGQAITRPTVFSSSSYQELTQTGVYLQDQIRYGSLIGTIGLRRDQSKIDSLNRITAVTKTTDDSATTGRVGLTYLMANGLAPYASYSTSFLPTPGVDRLGNIFRPQTGKQAEVGVKYEPLNGWGFATLSLYQNDLKNGRTPDPLNTQFSLQVGEQRVRGLELEVKADISNRVSLLAAYSYTSSEVRQSSNPLAIGRNMLRTPRHQASAWVDYRFESVPGLQAGIGGRYTSEYDTSDSYLAQLRIPSLFLWDLGASYNLGELGAAWKGARLRLTVANVSDKTYVSHCLSVMGSPCNYGAARTATATLSYGW
ncbi:TonB-dependent siderophore receptor [Herbaspirillum autotrophicum]|uniref:TonB-dependent siderophore receptor n=1 Tax=Herbaspirillum autotrophicum TaxID=180195 RepID=UPI00067D0FE2|nr:TonB-dependent siderophore receptor [Herbaspirillum autotrophicum]